MLPLEGITVPARPLEPGAAGEPFRYDYVVDLNSDGNHAKIVRWVGSGRRVLELGCATGYMSRAFRERGCQVVGVDLDGRAASRAREFCEQVIVGDLEEMDLAATLGEDRFDVVVAADVLEHLKDPPAILSGVKGLLRPDGYVVACVPNVAHGSVRLALFSGQFPYSERGLLDRTHLRFYTRQLLEQLFEDTGYEIRHLERHQKPFEASEVPFEKTAVPAETLQSLAQDPDALAYQFIVVAYPKCEVNPA